MIALSTIAICLWIYFCGDVIIERLDRIESKLDQLLKKKDDNEQ